MVALEGALFIMNFSVPNLPSWFRVFLFLHEFVQIAENQFNVFILTGNFLFDFFDFQTYFSMVLKHFSKDNKSTHNCNVHFFCPYAFQNT